MLCDPCFCLFASFAEKKKKKNLTYTRIPPRKTLRELIFHPKNKNSTLKPPPKVTGKVTGKVTDKVTDKVTERRHLEMQFCNDAIDERAIRLPYNGRKRNASLTTCTLDKRIRMKSGVRDIRFD